MITLYKFPVLKQNLFKKNLLSLFLILFVSLQLGAQTVLINPSGDGGFENGSTFAANGWTVVNGATNQWFVGSLTSTSGSNSAYISNDVAGTTYNYLNSSASTVHFYRDITFPSGQSTIELSFKWRGSGESSYDYVTVYSVPTSITPVYNSPTGGFQSWLNISTAYTGALVHTTPPNLNLQSTYKTQSICLPSSYAGTTRRLVFMWSNDGSGGSQFPGSIDDISLVSYSAPTSTPTAQATGLTLTAASTTQINGSFTAVSTDAYLVVGYAAGSATTAPTNGVSYNSGNVLGLGTVVSNGSAASFSATGLNPSTSYDFYVYSFNRGVCNAGPFYLTTTPLFGNKTTLNCTGLSGTYSVGPTGTYASITAALAATSTGIAGPVIFELQSTYVSSVETFPLTIAANACYSATQTVTIRPVTGATGLSITSANAVGTVNFDGGDYVIFDGRPGGSGTTSQLSISNSVTTGYSIQFINSATFNSIKYCSVSGVNTGTTSGVILFSTASGFVNGNSNNLIDNCDIKDGATNPLNLIYVAGSNINYLSNNNFNTVSNSTLHDWFNASSTTSGAAINIVTGASDWTINANSFYQTATRTFTMTSATDQGMIFVASTSFGINFNITNNYLGGSAAACGGTPLTWTGGTTGTPTPRLIRFSSAIGGFSNITGNTIKNISVTSASTSTAHSLISHLNGNVNISNNTIGSQSAVNDINFTAASTSTSPFFYVIGAGTGATVSKININNNNIGGITVSNSSTGTVSFRVVYSPAVAGCEISVTNNLVGGTVANSIKQSTNNLFSGIIILANTINQTVSGNTVRNLFYSNTGATGSLTGINCQSSTNGTYSITNNTIYNLTSNGTNIAFGNAPLIAGITENLLAGPGGNIISGNKVYNLVAFNTTTNVAVVGMVLLTSPPAVSTSGTSILSGNFIHSLTTLSNTSVQAGILCFNTGHGIITNNMIRLGIDSNGASITTSPTIYGIYKGSSANVGVYHNSVYIGGTNVASGTVNTYAFARVGAGTLDSVMNNIFVNDRSNISGTGKHYAEYLSAITAVNSNYNLLAAGGTGGVLGTIAGLDYNSIPTWQVATNQDWNSVTGNPQFINTTGTLTTVNLHINATTATPVEQAGLNIPQIFNDYDAQTRSSFTQADIGADAGNFVLSDIAAPVIAIAPIIGTCGTGDRTISGITITDATGVPTTGTLVPRIYYKKNTGSYFSQPGTLTSGTGINGVWSFTIAAADMSGLTPTDIVSFYIIAQDIVSTPNIASNAGGAIATNVNTIGTAPTTPFTYTINGTSLVGTYNVGAGQTYTTLTAAVAAYNTACLTGAVVFQLMDASYSASETFPITIAANPYASSTNTLTIKPAAGVNVSITGSSAASAVIKMLNANFIIIDGVKNSTTSLTIANANTAAASGAIWLASTAIVGPGTKNVTIQNAKIVGSSNTLTTSFGIVACVDGATPATVGGPDIDNITIQNDSIVTAYYGIYGNGIAAVNVGGMDNWNINNNVIGPVTSGTSNIGFAGISIQNAVNLNINSNTVQNVVATVSLAAGITLASNITGVTVASNNINNIYSSASASGTSSITGLFLGSRVTNALINKNTITTIVSTTTSGYGARGMIINPLLTAVSNITVSNNMISDVYCYQDASASFWPIGLDVEGTGSNINIYHNTVNLFGPHTGLTSTAGGSAAFFCASSGAFIDVRNNIFTNSYDNSTSSADKSYAIYNSTTSALMYSNLDYNAYSVASSNGVLGFINSTDRPTLADIFTGFSGNANSKIVTPTFVSNTNLHLITSTVNWCLNGTGATIAAVTSDFDGDARTTTPDIGADEITLSVTAVATPSTQSVCSNSPITSIVFSGTPTVFTWTRNNTATVTGIGASGTGNISGTLVNNTAAAITVTFTVNTLISGCAGPSFTATIVVSPLPTFGFTGSPNAVTGPPYTSFSNTNAAATYTVPSVAGVTYLWSITNGTITAGGTTNSVSVLWGTVNGSTGRIKLVETITATGCSRADSVLVGLGCATISPPYTATTLALPTTVCSGSTYTYSVTPITGYQYKWIVVGGTISGLASGTSVTVIWGAASTGASVRIIDSSNCAPSSTPINITINAAPSAIIAGPSSACANSFNSYSLGNITGTIASYNWTVTGGGVISSGQGTSTVGVTWGTAGAGTLSCTLTSSVGCTGTTPTFNVGVTANPTAIFTGPTTVCTSTPYTYAASTGTSASYTWIPANGTLISQAGNSVTIVWNNSATASLTLVEKFSNGCSFSTSQSINVTGPITGNITGSLQACINSNQAYSLNSTATVTTWSVTGGNITASTGTTANITWTTTGIQTLTANYTNGSCNYTYTLSVNVNALPTPVVTGPNTTCSGTNATYTTPGTAGRAYVWNITGGGNIISGQGTNSIIVFWSTTGGTTVNVNETIISTGCSVTSGSLIGVVLATPTSTITGSANACSSTTFTYTASAATTYSWSVTGGTISGAANGSSVNVVWGAAGTGTITLVSSNGICSANSTLPVAINATPTPVITGPNAICTGTATTFAATFNANHNYTWNVINGTYTAGGNGSVINVTPNTGATSVTISVTANVNGSTCSGTATKVLSVNVTPSVSITGNNVACQNSSQVYTGVGAASYTFSVTGGVITSTTATTATVTWGSSNGTISAIGTNVSGCSSSAQLAVTVNSLPSSVISGSAQVCANNSSSYNVVSQGGASYAWTVTGGAISGAANGNSVNVNWGSAGAGTVNVTVTSSLGCTSNRTMNVTINIQPTPSITGPATVCQNTNQTYSIVAISGAAYNWAVTGGNIVSGSGTNSITVNWTTVGNSSINVSQSNGSCVGSGNTSIVVNAAPAIPVVYKVGNNLSTTATATSYQWFNNGAAVSGATSQTLTAIAPGTYTLVVTNAQGCTTSSTGVIANVGIKNNANITNLMVYPNPATNVITIAASLGKSQNVTLNIFDMNGKLVYTISQINADANYSNSINLDGFASGVYMVQLVTNNGSVQQRIVKE